MSEKIQFTTPVGRLVQGSAFIPNTKNQKGAQLTDKQGNPRVEYFMAIAVAKNDPGLQEFVGKLQAAATAGFPNGQYNQPNFSWKYIDGDGIDAKGVPYSNREGFAGCFIFKFSTGFPPKVYTAGGASLIVDPETLKRGYYVRINGNACGNGATDDPGIFVNFGLVELVGYGPEITSGPDGAAVFGAAAPAHIPQGMSTTPVAPTQVIDGGMQQPAMQQPAMQQPAMQQPAMQQPAMQQPAMQQQPDVLAKVQQAQLDQSQGVVQPHTGFVNP